MVTDFLEGKLSASGLCFVGLDIYTMIILAGTRTPSLSFFKDLLAQCFGLFARSVSGHLLQANWSLIFQKRFIMVFLQQLS